MFHTRRMFGAGLPAAWPFAAVALHQAPGFVDRFRQAVAVSEAFIEQVTMHEAFTVERMPAGTNLFRLRVAAPELGAFRARLRDRGVDLGGASADGSGFLIGVNETWNRATADLLAERFVSALG
jgi:threonine aldolase